MMFNRVQASIVFCIAALALLWGNAVPAGSKAASAAAIAAVTTFEWAKSWGGSAGEVTAKSVAVDGSGNLFVAGEFSGTVDFDPAKATPGAIRASYNGTVDAFLVKFNANGQYVWVKVWGAGSLNPPCSSMGRACGRDAANAVVVDGAGNAYVAGLFQNTIGLGSGFFAISNAPNGSNNVFLAKFSADGAPQWLHAWGGLTGSEAYSLALDAARGFVYVQGDWSTSPSTGTVDFNPGGANGVRQNHGFFDAFLSKFDLGGNFQWVRTWGGSQYDDGPGVAMDDAGDIYVGGMYGSQDINFDPAGSPAGLGHPASDNSSMLMDVFLVKFDGGGNFQWVRTWGGAGTEESGALVAADHAGHVYLIGRFACTGCNFKVGAGGAITPGELHSTQGDFDAFLSAFDASGTFRWAATWGGAQIDIADAIAVDGDNQVYVGAMVNGTRESLTGRIVTSDAFLAKVSPGGLRLWSKTWGGSGADSPWSLALDAAKNVFAVGSFQGTVDFDPGSGVENHTAAGSSDAFLSKFKTTLVALPLSRFLPLIER